MFNIVLFEPEIPSNTGNIGRTCVVTGARLHLIKPYGFDLSDDKLRRAGMNYWHNLDVTEYENWDDFVRRALGTDAGGVAGATGAAAPALHLLTKRASKTFTQATYRDGDYLVFGKESTGIPADVLTAHASSCERIPMLPDAVALDDAPQWHARHEQLAGASAPGATESAVRPDICGNFVTTDAAASPGISSLNLSNSVAIVLYEALRQAGYPEM